jgi:hypothetical protein
MLQSVRGEERGNHTNSNKDEEEDGKILAHSRSIAGVLYASLFPRILEISRTMSVNIFVIGPDGS